MNDAILKFRRYEDAPLAYTAPNRHASGTRIGLGPGAHLITKLKLSRHCNNREPSSLTM